MSLWYQFIDIDSERMTQLSKSDLDCKHGTFDGSRVVRQRKKLHEHRMSLTPGSPPRTPHSPPYTPGTPHTPLTPRNASIPRPPSSPLRRPASQASLRSTPVGASGSMSATRRVSGHGVPGSAPGSVSGLGLDTGVSAASRQAGGVGTTPGTPQKTRARDLLRKHYGLGLGPPPPLGNGKSSQDPMDFGE